VIIIYISFKEGNVSAP